MLRDNIFSFFLLLGISGTVFAQASSQREVRITNPTNSNYISLLSPSGLNAPPSTYSLILPTALPTGVSLLYCNGSGATGTLNWTPSPTTDGQVLIISGGSPTWSNGSFMQYDVSAAQNTSMLRTHNLFNVAYNGLAPDANAAGAVITSTGGTINSSATGLTITSIASGIGVATGLSVLATGGGTRNAVDATGNVNILSSGGVANSLSLQNPGGTFSSSFTAGAQTQNINYTLPSAPPLVNGQVLAATTTGILTWVTSAAALGSNWSVTGNSGLIDNVNNYLGTLDNSPIRFVSGSTGTPNTRMLLDISGNLLFGPGAGTSSFTTGTGRMAFGDALTTARLNSVPTIGTNVFNMIDANAALRVWRYATNGGNSDPAIDLIGGLNDDQANSANQWWTLSSTGTPGNSTSGTNGTGEHLTFRRRTGGTDSEYVAIFAGGNVGIGANSSGYIPTPSNKLTVVATDAETTTTTDVVSIGHNSTATPSTSFGTGLVFKGQSSSTADRNIAKVGALWTDATDASRKGALTFTTDSLGSDLERVRITGDGYVGIGTSTPGIRADINGGYATKSRTVTLSSSGPNNDVPVGDCAFLRIVGPTAPFTITGLQAGVDGQRLRIANITGKDMTIADSSSLSSAGNRIETNTNSDIIVKGPVPILDMTYDGATAQWLLGTLNANQIIGGIGSIYYVYKTSDESVGSNTTGSTLQDDDHLFFPVAISQTWELNGEIAVTCSSTTPDLKMAFTIPGGATMNIMYTAVQNANGNGMMGNGQMTSAGTGYACDLDNTNAVLISFRGIIRTTTSAGTIQFRWCQNTGSASNPVTVKQDSYMKIIRIQ